MAVVIPAELLSGAQLTNGWIVGARLQPGPCATGGRFSVPYSVSRLRDDGSTEVAFLKALDFRVAATMKMPTVDALRILLNAYTFERDLVMACAGSRMTNVVRAIDAGSTTIDDDAIDPFLAEVPYIIFEAADGDIRDEVLSRIGTFDSAWSYRILHGVANGLRQLHQQGITHQDLKPSNVMAFGSIGKVGDLGRASAPSIGDLYDEPDRWGDLAYAPPELLYEEYHPDGAYRRLACDSYHLGSMLVFIFTGSGLTPLVLAQLAPTFDWRTWPRGYRNALPYVRNAYDYALGEVEAAVSEALRVDVMRLVRELCDPDPLVRGNPKAGASTRRFSMERYVARFDNLARAAERVLVGKA